MTTPLNHDEFQALLPDFLEAGTLDAATREAAAAHLLACAECAALVTDLRRVVAEAHALPALSPSRDLWTGVEARIEAAVVPLDRRSGELTDDRVSLHTTARPRSRIFLSPSWRRLAVAASVLIAVTAGVTYTLSRRTASPRIAAGAAASTAADRPTAGMPATTGVSTLAGAPAPAVVATNASHPSAEETFAAEISSLRRIVDERRAELDTATIAVLEKSLGLIDSAIAESRAALARDPASPFLTDRLNRSYGSKLQLLRDVATLPSRS